jgi:DNA mismatch endonuclease (patch repair protein)
MRAIRRRDTRPERDVRSALHQAGKRFQVDAPITAPGRRPIRPDLVFVRPRVAVFVDGCFWHGCPIHGVRRAHSPPTYWNRKIARNRERDREQTTVLENEGWVVVRFWEHEDPVVIAWWVEHILAFRRQVGRDGQG